MEGSFRFGDTLIIESVPFEDVRPGDIVVFQRMNDFGVKVDFVHRTISVQREGLITQGDNNSRQDKNFVTEGNLVGRVCYVERDGKKIEVCNGPAGLLRSRVRRGLNFMWNEIWRAVSNMGRTFYRWLRESGLTPLLWRPAISKVFLMTENGPMIKYISRNRTVGRYWPENGRFKCRKPYDLVLWDRIPQKKVGEKTGPA